MSVHLPVRPPAEVISLPLETCARSLRPTETKPFILTYITGILLEDVVYPRLLSLLLDMQNMRHYPPNKQVYRTFNLKRAAVLTLWTVLYTDRKERENQVSLPGKSTRTPARGRKQANMQGTVPVTGKLRQSSAPTVVCIHIWRTKRYNSTLRAEVFLSRQPLAATSFSRCESTYQYTYIYPERLDVLLFFSRQGKRAGRSPVPI